MGKRASPDPCSPALAHGRPGVMTCSERAGFFIQGPRAELGDVRSSLASGTMLLCDFGEPMVSLWPTLADLHKNHGLSSASALIFCLCVMCSPEKCGSPLQAVGCMAEGH